MSSKNVAGITPNHAPRPLTRSTLSSNPPSHSGVRAYDPERKDSTPSQAVVKSKLQHDDAASLANLVNDVFGAAHTELPTPVAFIPAIPSVAFPVLPPDLPKLWARDPARSTGARGEYDDEATEVSSWTRFVRHHLVPPVPDTLRDVPGIAIEPRTTATLTAPKTITTTRDIQTAFAELKLLVVAAVAELRGLESRLQRTHYALALAAPIILALFASVVVVVGHRPTAATDSSTSSAARTKVSAAHLPPPIVVAPSAEPSARPETKRADTVELTLSAAPEGAQFRIDQGPLLKSPYTGRVPRDERDHEVIVSAKGYFARAVKARFTKDITLEIPLQKIPVRPTPAPATRPNASETAPELPIQPATPRPIEREDPYGR